MFRKIFPLFLFLIIFLILPSNAKMPIQIGIYYCLWFKADYPSGSWNNTIIIDKPILGYYNSQDYTIIKQHIQWFNELKIDFVMMIWRPIDSFVNQTMFNVLETAKNESYYTKFAVLVEHIDTWSFTEIYNYIYNIVQNYNPIYYRYQGKPLIIFFNDSPLNEGNFPHDDRFTVKIAGSVYYVDWLYENISPYHQGVSPRDRHFPIIPRFDETNFDNETRPNQYFIDKELAWLYEKQWQDAIKLYRQNKIDVITITAWNEYPERSNIEPHIDATALNKDPYYLYNLTKQYINQIRGESVFSIEKWYENPKNYAIVMSLIVFGIILGKWFYDNV